MACERCERQWKVIYDEILASVGVTPDMPEAAVIIRIAQAFIRAAREAGEWQSPQAGHDMVGGES